MSLALNLLQVAVGGVLGAVPVALAGLSVGIGRMLGDSTSLDVYAVLHPEDFAGKRCHHCAGGVAEEDCTYPGSQLRMIRCVACAKPLFYFTNH